MLICRNLAEVGGPYSTSADHEFEKLLGRF